MTYCTAELQNYITTPSLTRPPDPPIHQAQRPDLLCLARIVQEGVEGGSYRRVSLFSQLRLLGILSPLVLDVEKVFGTLSGQELTVESCVLLASS
jgi:hypothetical protein